MFIDTLHPVHEGRIFRWRSDGKEEEPVRDYGPEQRPGRGVRIVAQEPVLPSAADRRRGAAPPHRFRRCRRLPDHPGDEGCRPYRLPDLRPSFFRRGSIGEMDSVFSAWSTDHRDGFTDANVAALRRLVPALGLAIKNGALSRILETVVDVYLGHDAGKRVLDGRNPARRRRSHRHRAVVLRPALLHHHHRYRSAGRDHPAAERLRGRGHHRDPGGGRRRPEADRRRHPGDLPRRGSRAPPAPRRSRPKARCAAA